MTAIEKQLGIKTSTKTFQNISPKTLKTATEMFLYLYSCPHFADPNSASWFKKWVGFYSYLFKTTAPDKIILTLNTMLKQESAPGSAQGRIDTVLKTTGTLFSLKFEQIQSVLPGTMILNSDQYEIILAAKHLIFEY